MTSRRVGFGKDFWQDVGAGDAPMVTKATCGCRAVARGCAGSTKRKVWAKGKSARVRFDIREIRDANVLIDAESTQWCSSAAPPKPLAWIGVVDVIEDILDRGTSRRIVG